jgi:hypothetical protein
VKKAYVLILVLVFGYALASHIRLPYSEEWLIYDFFFRLKELGPSQLGGFFDFQSNHIILMNRLFYAVDFLAGLKGTLVLFLSALFNVLTCYLLEFKLFPRARGVLERVLLYLVFFSLLQFETYIHPHIINYGLYNLTLMIFILNLNTSYRAPSALLISGFNMLNWASLFPVFIYNQLKLKTLKLKAPQVLSLLIFVLLGLLYSNSIQQDPYHGEIYWSVERVFKYFFISYSSFLPFVPTLDGKLICGLVLFGFNFLVWHRGTHNQRLILIAGVFLNLMIALGRASGKDGAFINSIQSRYYTLWAPVYFVNVDFWLAQSRHLMKKGICLGLLLLSLYSVWAGFEGSRAFKERRLAGIECLRVYYETGNIKADCNTHYLFLAGIDQPPHKDFGRTVGGLSYTSHILRKLGYWEKHER